MSLWCGILHPSLSSFKLIGTILSSWLENVTMPLRHSLGAWISFIMELTSSVNIAAVNSPKTYTKQRVGMLSWHMYVINDTIDTVIRNRDIRLNKLWSQKKRTGETIRIYIRHIGVGRTTCIIVTYMYYYKENIMYWNLINEFRCFTEECLLIDHRSSGNSLRGLLQDDCNRVAVIYTTFYFWNMLEAFSGDILPWTLNVSL